MIRWISFVFILGLAPFTASAGISYVIINIGEAVDPGVGYGTYPTGIDVSGEVVGYVNEVSGSTGTFLYSGSTTTLLNAPEFMPAGMNDSGDIAGWVFVEGTGYTTEHAALYREGQVYDLGTFPGADTANDDFSIASAVNNAGDVAGTADTTMVDTSGDAEEHAFYDSNGTFTDLGTINGGLNSTGEAINNSGTVVGKVRTSGSDDHAAIYANGDVTDINDKLGSGIIYSDAHAINDSGQVAGVAYSETEGFGYIDTSGAIKKIGAIAPESINSEGDVAGSSSDTDDNSVAAVYVGGVLYASLQTLVEPGNMADFVSLDDAVAINDDGLVAGYGTLASGEVDAFLAIPAIGLAGTHDGLATVSGSNAGYINVNVRSTDAFTAMLKTPQHSYSFSGKFTNGAFAGPVKLSKTVTLTVSLQSNNGTGTISGTINDGTTTYSVTAKEYDTYTRQSPAPETGAYTAILPVASGLPQGQGWATLSVSVAGISTIHGKLGDGSAFTVKAHVHKDKSVTVYQELYAGKDPGAIIGEFTFESGTNSDCDGTLRWTKPPQAKTTEPFAAGFDGQVSFYGSAFTAPALTAAGYNLSLSGAGINPIEHTIDVSSKGAAMVTDPTSDKLALKLDLKNGTYTGSFIPAGGNARIPFTGIVYQDEPSASGGVFLSGTVAGTVAFP
ncbi:MAG TPA: hypothetical protein VHY22_04080 [Chthoniobacteraceae bacterium]|nr:hypothetical protein [Chthoniobacteraceae bacterium]